MYRNGRYGKEVTNGGNFWICWCRTSVAIDIERVNKKKQAVLPHMTKSCSSEMKSKKMRICWHTSRAVEVQNKEKNKLATAIEQQYWDPNNDTKQPR